MKQNKDIQLELPFIFGNDQKISNIISFPHEKVVKKKKDERQAAIKKGLEKSVKSLRWYK